MRSKVRRSSTLAGDGPTTGSRHSQSPEHGDPPKIGMSLFWRLGLTASAIVISLLSALLAWQDASEVERWRHDRSELLAESLAPLQADIEQAGSWDEIELRLRAFEAAYATGRHPHHRLLLQNDAGIPVAMSSDEPDLALTGPVMTAEVPISSSLLAHHSGKLIVQQDASQFEEDVRRLRIRGGITIAVTVLALLLGLFLANRFLVTRPLSVLLKGVAQMERGYWQNLQVPRGAWEMRWLGYRFQKLGAKVEETMRQLVEAEKRAVAPAAMTPAETAQHMFEELVTLDSRKDAAASTLAMRLESICATLERQPPGSKELVNLARRVWDVDAWLADRLGDSELKSRLETAAMRTLHPETFHRLQHALDLQTAQLASWMEDIETEIRNSLEPHGFNHLEIQKRIKSVASIWRKMQSKDLEFNQVQDIIAFRIILADTPDCYRALRLMHDHFHPQLLRFKDYIAHPKASGYRSLHTSVKNHRGPVFEIQIRSLDMHRQAELGAAAHWRYKQDQGLPVEHERPNWWRRIRQRVVHRIQQPPSE